MSLRNFLVGVLLVAFIAGLGWAETKKANKPSAANVRSATLDTHNFTFWNKCTYPVWVASAGNAKDGGGFYPSQGDGGWYMASDTNGSNKKAITVDYGWKGRFWPRTLCYFDKVCSNASTKYCAKDGDCPTGGTCQDTNKCTRKRCSKHPDKTCTVNSDCTSPEEVCSANCCGTGGCKGSDNTTFQLKCGPGQGGEAPATLAEFSLDYPDGHGIPYDTYDLSMVDGYNVPFQITPQNFDTTNPYSPNLPDDLWCTTAGCGSLPTCSPAQLVYWDGVSCLGPCKYVTRPASTSSKDDRARLCCDNSNCTPKTSAPCNCPGSKCNCENACFDNGGYGCSPIGPGDNDEKCYAHTSGKHGYWGDDWVKYQNNIIAKCGHVYTWQFKDEDNTFQCRQKGAFADYNITFCP
jgi:hypothetical protein